MAAKVAGRDRDHGQLEQSSLPEETLKPLLHKKPCQLIIVDPSGGLQWKKHSG